MKEVISLAEKYQDYFKIGVAINPHVLNTSRDLIKKHFNSITAENEMKPISLNREKGKFNFELADGLVNFAKENNMVMRGHTLVWHNQTPDHLFLNEDGSFVDKEVLEERLREYIRTVFDHFNADLCCWDVVNEAVEDKGDWLLRKSRWLDIMGENFLDVAFRIARELDPDIKLFYNDYDAVLPHKRDKIYTLVKGMLDRGVPIDGIGIQGHWNIHDFKLDDIKAALDKYASLGLEIHVTELDVSIYGREDRETILEAPTAELLEKQAEFYGDIFAIFREYKDVVKSVTFWGVADDYSWLDYFRVRRKNWPLLFDENHQPKEAYWRVIDF